MRTELDTHATDLRLLVDLTVASLLADTLLPAGRRIRRGWRAAWGSCAYGNGVSNDNLTGLTLARKDCLQRIFDHALDAVRTAVEEDRTNAVVIRQLLGARRVRTPRHLAAILLAIEAALDLLWLEQHTAESGLPLKLALCYSAFGDIAATVAGQARELGRLFHGMPAELHIFAVAGMDDATDRKSVV